MKVLLSLDERLVARIDLEAERLGLSRSAYLARLAARELDARGGPGSTATARSAVQRLQRLFATNPVPTDATGVIRAARDAQAESS